MYFYQIKYCFYTQNGCMNKKKYYNRQFCHKYLIDSANSYVPRLYHNMLNTTINKTLSLENFRRHGATPRLYLHVANI